MTSIHRWLLKSARTVHMYLTLFGLGLLLFFVVTGYMLNHEDWFCSPDPHERSVSGELPQAMLEPLDKLAIVEKLRKDFGANGALDSFEEEDDRYRVVFSGPGRRSEAVIERSDGRVQATHFSRGVAGIMLDLHRAKSTGKVWSVLVDALCILLLIVASTGFYLWTSLRGRGRYGLVVLVAGVVLSAVAYVAFVP